MAEEQERQKALDVAYRFLGKRDRTLAEVRRRLERAQLDQDAIEHALETLVEQRYLDDDRYAQRFAEDRRSLDGWGSERIRQRLLAVGVEPELAARASRSDQETELERALAVLRRRAPGCTTREERERALGMLLRRGYELELACDALRALRRERAPA